MTVYIFTVEIFNDKNELEYRTIKGVYDNKEAANEEAQKALNNQTMWPDSEVIVISDEKTVLKTVDGYSKVYCVKPIELNKTY